MEITIKTWEEETDVPSAQNIFGAEEEKANTKSQSLFLPELIDKDYFKFEENPLQLISSDTTTQFRYEESSSSSNAENVKSDEEQEFNIQTEGSSDFQMPGNNQSDLNLENECIYDYFND